MWSQLQWKPLYIKCDQIDPDLPSPKSLSVRYFIQEGDSLNVIIRIVLSLPLCPKVITLSSFHCTVIILLRPHLLSITIGYYITIPLLFSYGYCNNFCLVSKWSHYVASTVSKNSLIRVKGFLDMFKLVKS
jgi:hypothetical protein